MFAKGTQSFLLCLLPPVPFSCLIVPPYLFISWFVSSASTSPMWPSFVVFIQEEQHFGLLGHILFCPTLNLPRVHWKLMASSGTLSDPLWRKVPKSISRAHMYLGSAESFEGDCTPVPFDPSWAQLLKHPAWTLAWLAHAGKESVNPCPCSNNLPVHWQVEQGFPLTELFSPLYSHCSFIRVLAILVIS